MWKSVAGETVHSCGDSIPQNLSKPKESEGKLNCENVVQRVEKRLLRLEARVKAGDGDQVLRQKVELVKRKLQRYYFLMKLLPLSKRPSDFFAFIEKSKVIH